MVASSFLDVCRFTPTAGGTTDWTYSSAVVGYQSPVAAGVVNGTQYSYRSESADQSQWEEGQGTYNTSTGVLSRTSVLFNSSGTGTGSGQSGAGTKITFSTVPQVAIVALAEDLQPAFVGYTPTITATAGAYGGSPTVSACSYMISGKTIDIQFDFTLPSSLGTASGYAVVSTPVNFTSVITGTAQEINNGAGTSTPAVGAANTFILKLYNNGNTIAANNRWIGGVRLRLA